MATDRKSYFAVADSILREGWSADLGWSLVMLMAFLHQRWSRDRIQHHLAGEASIHIADLMVITGKRRADVARTLASRWADVTSMSVRHQADVTLIDWPKYPLFQQFGSRSPGSHAPVSGPPEKETEKETDKKKTRAPRSPPPGWALTCSDLLIELLEPVPGARIPRGARTSWARQFEALATEAPELSNGAAAQHIEGAIRWALGPLNLGLQYEVIIRSGRALREKWPKLRAAANRAEKARVPTAGEFEADVLRRVRGNPNG